MDRAELLLLEENTDYLEAEVAIFDPAELEHPSPLTEEAMVRTLKELLDDYCSENSKLAKAFQNVLQIHRGAGTADGRDRQQSALIL